MLVQDFIDEFERWKGATENAMGQVSDEALNRVLAPNGNSIAMLVRHMGANLSSRFTDFLTTDGEKPWRDRDGEFADGELTRRDVEDVWKRGLSTAERALRGLSDADLEKTVVIRGQSLTVHAALCRSIAHFSNHAGQIILLARILATNEWKWITIPKGESKQYNANPTMERAPVGR